MSNKLKPYDDKSLMDVFRNIPSTGTSHRNKSYGCYTSAETTNMKSKSLYHEKNSGHFSTQSHRTLNMHAAYSTDTKSVLKSNFATIKENQSIVDSTRKRSKL